MGRPRTRARLRAGVRRLLRRHGLFFAWLVAAAAAASSLVFSEALGWQPCPLCWVQRAFMFPLAVVLGIASYRDDEQVVVYALPLALLGAAVAAYHYLLQKLPGAVPPGLCGPASGCAATPFDWLGFVTIPLLSLAAFAAIALLLVVTRRVRTRRGPGRPSRTPPGEGGMP